MIIKCSQDKAAQITTDLNGIANIRLGLEGFPRTKTQAYFARRTIILKRL
jgi:hypothetical protein